MSVFNIIKFVLKVGNGTLEVIATAAALAVLAPDDDHSSSFTDDDPNEKNGAIYNPDDGNWYYSPPAPSIGDYSRCLRGSRKHCGSGDYIKDNLSLYFIKNKFYM